MQSHQEIVSHIYHQIEQYESCIDQYTPTVPQARALQDARKAITNMLESGAIANMHIEERADGDEPYATAFYLCAQGINPVDVDTAALFWKVAERMSTAEFTGAHRPTEIVIPSDTVNKRFWPLDHKNDPKTSHTYAISNSGKVALAADIDTWPRNFTAFDKEVYLHMDALWISDNKAVTVTQICRSLDLEANGHNTAKVMQSIDAMRMSYIRMRVGGYYNRKREPVEKEYDGPVLPCTLTHGYVNGRYSDTLIRFGQRPPLTEYAVEIGQYGALAIGEGTSLRMIGQSELRLKINDYIRIRAMSKIHEFTLADLYKTVTGSATPKDKKRINAYVTEVMELYSEEWGIGLIGDWKVLDKTGAELKPMTQSERIRIYRATGELPKTQPKIPANSTKIVFTTPSQKEKKQPQNRTFKAQKTSALLRKN